MPENLIRGHFVSGVHHVAPSFPEAPVLHRPVSSYIPTRRMDGFQRSLIVVDGLALFLSFVISYVVSYFVRDALMTEWVGGLRPLPTFLWLLWVIVPVWIASLWFFGFYHSNRFWPYKELLMRLAQAQVVAALGVMSIFYLSK